MRELRYLDVTVDDGIAHVVLDRPPVNAVNQEMYREIQALFSAIVRFRAWSEESQTP